jgi:hypothetical protein
MPRGYSWPRKLVLCIRRKREEINPIFILLKVELEKQIFFISSISNI